MTSADIISHRGAISGTAPRKGATKYGGYIVPNISSVERALSASGDFYFVNEYRKRLPASKCYLYTYLGKQFYRGPWCRCAGCSDPSPSARGNIQHKTYSIDGQFCGYNLAGYSPSAAKASPLIAVDSGDL